MKANHRDLPRGSVRQGEVPSPVTLVADSYALQLLARRADRPGPSRASRFHFSNAAGCARKNGYAAQGIEPDEQPGAIDLHVMDAGTRGHDVLQHAFLLRWWPGAETDPTYIAPDGRDPWGLPGACMFEVMCELEGVGTGRADVWCEAGIPGTEYEGRRLAVEAKHVGGWAWKLQIGERGAAQGPRWSAKVQGALVAQSLDAEVLCLSTVATEVVSKGLAQGKNIPETHRGMGDWFYERDEWEPWALMEQSRVRRMLAILDEGGLPPRQISDPEIPAKARIVNPQKGAWTVEAGGTTVETGTYFMCAHYCGYRDRCDSDGPS